MDELLDALELELRQIPGVRVVGFGDREGTCVVQLGVTGEVDQEDLGRRATQLAQTHLDQPAVVELVAEGRAAAERVRVLAVIILPDGEIEVHLAKGGQRTVGRRRAQDEVASAVAGALAALEELGLAVPFQAGWAGPLGDPSGQAIAVSLEATDGAGTRWGVAVGPTPAEAAVRATLDALNRHLADRRAPPAT